MKNFAEFIKKNKEKAYATAHANVRHDSDGHCLFSRDDPWMNDTRWDDDFTRTEAHKIAAN